MMATSINSYRLSKLMVDGGTYFAKELLLREIDKTRFVSMDAFLNNQTVKSKLAMLHKRNILKQSQIDILYPKTNSVQIDKLDTTLLTCILTNCVKLNTDQTNAVDRLRSLRNSRFAHSSSFSLEDTDFEQQWEDLAKFLENESHRLLPPRCTTYIKHMIKRVESEILTANTAEAYIRTLTDENRSAIQTMDMKQTETLKIVKELLVRSTASSSQENSPSPPKKSKLEQTKESQELVDQQQVAIKMVKFNKSQSNSVQIDKLDTTLLTCILTNCVKLNTDQTKAVDRLRNLRNSRFAHSSSFSLEDTDFEQQWKDLANFLENESHRLLPPRCATYIKDMIKRVESEILTANTAEAYIRTLTGENRSAIQTMDMKQTETLKTVNEIHSIVKSLQENSPSPPKKSKLEQTKESQELVDQQQVAIKITTPSIPEDNHSNDDGKGGANNISSDTGEGNDTSTPSTSSAKNVHEETSSVEHVISATPSTPEDNHYNDDGKGGANNISSDTGEGNDSELELRDYQLELAENALAGKSTVIVAATGTGKTWVALHIVREHLKQGKRKVVFMARTSVLIKQQADRLRKHLPKKYRIKLISGESDEASKLEIFIPLYDVFCFTPQILLNNLESKRSIKSLSEFSLLILDECHHTKGNEPYNTLMRRYLMEKLENPLMETRVLPQIVGLTASIGVGPARNDEEACDYILRILANLDVRVVSTVQRFKDQYDKFTPNSTEELIRMENPRTDPCRDILLEAIHYTEGKLKEFTLPGHAMEEIIVEKCPPDKQSQAYSKWTADVEIFTMNSFPDNQNLRNVRTCAVYLNVYNAAFEVNSLLGASDVFKYLETKRQSEENGQKKLTIEEKYLFDKLTDVQNKLKTYTTNENINVRKLSDTLREMMSSDEDESRAIVFVKTRATCTALARFLEKDFSDTDIAVHMLYGKDTRGGLDGMSESIQNDIVKKFRNGVYKILVGTSVFVEGIDVQDCNIVLNYNFRGNDITKIQMKGRSRTKEGHNIIIGDEKHLEQESVNAYKVLMMRLALERFLELDKEIIEKKVAFHQHREVEEYKKGIQNQEDKPFGNYEILCKRCDTLACYTSDIRNVKDHYIVIDKRFGDKIKEEPHPKPTVVQGFRKKSKMVCKKCPQDWGTVSVNNGQDCWTLTLRSFLWRKVNTTNAEQFKTWKNVPVKIQKIDLDDLTKLLREVPQE